MTSDGAGGTVLAWRDLRNGASDIYAQRINESGAAMWAVNGIAVCNAVDIQYSVEIISDGIGGTILCWADARTLAGTGYDVFAQRLNSLGAASWTANGVTVVSTTGGQDAPMLVSDDAGGAIVVWHDNRSSNHDIYAQHLYPTGRADVTGAAGEFTPVPVFPLWHVMARAARSSWEDYPAPHHGGPVRFEGHQCGSAGPPTASRSTAAMSIARRHVLGCAGGPS
jgi:hypothetical protein